MMNERDYWRRDSGSGDSAPWASWSAVKTLLISNIAVFFLCNVNNGFVDFLALSWGGMEKLQVWKPFTYMFTHVDFMHIFGNMWSLWIFGGILEPVLGKRRMIQLYVFSGLIGAATWLLANWGAPAGCIGASGSTFGIMCAAAMAYPDVKIQLLFPPVAMRLRTLAIVFGVYEIFLELGNSGYDNVAHLAHIGGMLGAFIYMRQLSPRFRLFGGNGGFSRWFSSLFKRQNTGSGGTDGNANRQGMGKRSSRLGNLRSEDVDRVLDKLATSGRSSLTPEEAAILEEASRRLKDD